MDSRHRQQEARMRHFFPLLATLAVIAVDAAARVLSIDGMGAGASSARYRAGFTPAGPVRGRRRGLT
jgi:hypothetical protein